MKSIIRRTYGAPIFLLIVVVHSLCYGQFGAKPGDVVLYAVTANGSGDFQVVPPSTTNTASAIASFRTTSLSSVPIETSEPFTLLRQPLYQTPTETFAVGTDPENTVGLHRRFLLPVKVLEIAGLLNPYGQVTGSANTFVSFPQALDVGDDVALETEVVAVWYPGQWPFIIPTDQRGPVGPPSISGFEYLFQLPGGVVFPFLLPWTEMSQAYPGTGWPDGVDLRLIDTDNGLGTTIRQLRIRRGKQTPVFRISGHTHLFVLEGQVTITPIGGAPLVLNQNDYAFLPEGFSVTLTNPSDWSSFTAR